MPDPQQQHPGFNASLELLKCLNRLGAAVEHLAKAMDASIELFEDAADDGKNPVSLLHDAISFVGQSMGRKRR